MTDFFQIKMASLASRILKQRENRSPGLPDGMFSKPKIQFLGKFLRLLLCKMLVYFTALWSILQQFGIFCDHLVDFMVVW
jgi:hypothetical protein